MPCRPSSVAELDVDRLVQVPIELGAERVELAAGGLALVEVQRQQVLQVVAARVAGRRQHPAELEVEQRRLDVVERVVGIPGVTGLNPDGEPGERRQHGCRRERVHHPERDVAIRCRTARSRQSATAGRCPRARESAGEAWTRCLRACSGRGVRGGHRTGSPCDLPDSGTPGPASPTGEPAPVDGQVSASLCPRWRCVKLFRGRLSGSACDEREPRRRAAARKLVLSRRTSSMVYSASGIPWVPALLRAPVHEAVLYGLCMLFGTETVCVSLDT